MTNTLYNQMKDLYKSVSEHCGEVRSVLNIYALPENNEVIKITLIESVQLLENVEKLERNLQSLLLKLHTHLQIHSEQKFYVTPVEYDAFFDAYYAQKGKLFQHQKILDSMVLVGSTFSIPGIKKSIELKFQELRDFHDEMYKIMEKV